MRPYFLRFYQPRTHAKHVLICLPHAGGSASSFRSWPSLLRSEEIEVAAIQYPGREDRFAESKIDNMPQLLHALEQELEPLLVGRSYSLLGHSMGGAIAHELAQNLTAKGMAPQQLFISGRQPPRFHPLNSTIHLESDEEIIQELLRLSPNNKSLIEQSELTALILPIIRNDYKLIESYQPSVVRPLTCPITVLAGRDDLELPDYQAHAWIDYTKETCSVHFYSGDHFFISEQRAAVIKTVEQILLALNSTQKMRVD